MQSMMRVMLGASGNQLFWWYDAQALTGLANLDPMGTWPDVSGNARTATADTATTANQPHYYAAAINGHPAVRFQFLSGNGRAFTMPGTFTPTEAHLFIVSAVETTSPPYHLGSQSTGFDPSFPATVTGTASLFDHFASSTRRTVGPTGLDTTAGFLYHAHAAAGQWDAEVGGAQKYTNAVNTMTTGLQKLGAWIQGGSFVNIFQGYIGEFRVYTGAMTTADVLQVQSDLITKWGLPSAPPPAGGSTTYWRVLVTATNGDTFARIGELQLRTTAGGSNVATGGTIIFSTQFSSSGDNSAAAAFDGNSATAWAGTAPAAIGYIFPSARTINEIVITARNDSFGPNGSPSDFTVQSSANSGATWTDEWSVTGQTGWTAGSSRTFTRP